MESMKERLKSMRWSRYRCFKGENGGNETDEIFVDIMVTIFQK